MTYWVKDCDCKIGGCMSNAPEVSAREEGGMIIFTMNIGRYRCSHCGKAWKLVEELPGEKQRA